MKFWKKCALFVASLFLLACIAVASLYVAQVHYGICLKEGRVLSSEELRERVLVNLVNLEVRDSFDVNWYRGNDSLWAGIANSVTETDFKKILEKAYKSEKSIEENFGLEVLVRGRKDKNGQYKKTNASISKSTKRTIYPCVLWRDE